MSDKQLQTGIQGESRRRFLQVAGLAAGGAFWPTVSRAEALFDAPAPVVETTTGPLRGLSADGTYAYLGIPYAQAKRFAAPTPAPSWTGIRDCRAFAGERPESGLHLNVWTSASTASPSRPVWVRIPGGGFDHGSDKFGFASFNGAAAANRSGAVVVTVNHRAGLLGYMHLSGEEFAAANHAGNLDLAAALEWVRANVRGFGGDPNNVTIFSGDGGECKVSCLLNMPAAGGLFHRAFLHAGTTAHRLSPRAANEFTAALLRELRFEASRERVLRSLPLATLLSAAAAAQAKLPRDISAEFRPLPDGRILTAGLFESPEAEAAAGLAFLTESSTTDGPLHHGHFVEDPDPQSFHGPELGRVRTSRYRLCWREDPRSGVPAHSVEVVTNHVIALGQKLDRRQLRRAVANAAFLTLARNPRA